MEAVSIPVVTGRSSIVLSALTTITVDLLSPIEIAWTGTASADGILSSVRFAVAYIPGLSISWGFLTSISVSIVRVALSTFPENRQTRPLNDRRRDPTLTSTGAP